MPSALLVIAHPRKDSLTARVAALARDRLGSDGFAVDVLDLHAEGFDPRMTPADEPDWTDLGKAYSPEVGTHMDRLDAVDLIVVVFPVWWYGLPAVLKGWIDRVWNYGFAYGQGSSRLSGKRIRWLALAGESAETYAEHGLDRILRLQLRTGISEFCGITDVDVRFLHGSIPESPGDAAIARFLGEAERTLAASL